MKKEGRKEGDAGLGWLINGCEKASRLVTVDTPTPHLFLSRFMDFSRVIIVTWCGVMKLRRVCPNGDDKDGHPIPIYGQLHYYTHKLHTTCLQLIPLGG
ncbi:hypothetical protein Pmani_023657 [Petrolisthes manimaculis]|uniref:Uncharacterized protein n=1 Tax=Petrolisthes manimaculis TaxID=1843537 RepID=A0AAE1PA85_9EUCA|nr:hypothetical protein Pmani_023657 [Petrolisthes manimaculis]